MTTIEILLSGFIIILGLIYAWCKYNYSYWKRNGIPYIEPLPIIGNTKVALTMKTSFGLHLSDLYNDPKVENEPVVGIYSMHKPALIIRDPEVIKSVLIKDFNKFSNRFVSADPHNDALAFYNLFFVRNPQWKEIRSKLTPVFTSGKIKQMYPLMLEITEELEKHLASYQTKNNTFEVEIKDVCANFTTDLIATIAYGLKVNSLQNPKVEFREHGRKFFQFNIVQSFSFFIAFFLPKLVSVFRVTLFPKDFSNYLREIFSNVMTEREKTGAKRNDLIDVLVNLKQSYSDNADFLLAQATVFLTAGFETSSSTMAFALYELSYKPDLQKRLREEIHEALVECNGQLTYEKIHCLEYLDMVLSEVLRMYPTLPFLDRVYENPKGEKEYTLAPHYNYTFEEGLPVFVPVYAIHRDPQYWENPDEFNPERFTSENKQHIKAMTYFPFGGGPHNCIGSRIGLLQAKLGLVHILKNHFVEPCAKTLKKMEFDAKSFLLQSDGGIYLRVVNDQMYDKQK